MIMSNNIKHTLLIDDRRLFAGKGISHWGNVKEDEILGLIKGKSKNIKVSYSDGYVKDDVMVVKYE